MSGRNSTSGPARTEPEAACQTGGMETRSGEARGPRPPQVRGPWSPKPLLDRRASREGPGQRPGPRCARRTYALRDTMSRSLSDYVFRSEPRVNSL